MSTPAVTPTTEELKAAALAVEQPAAVAAPAAPPEPVKGDGYTVSKTAEGVVVELDTGEKFLGANEMEALASLAKGKREATLHIKSLKQPPAEPAAPVTPSEEEQAAELVLGYVAKGLGTDVPALRRDLERIQQQSEANETRQAASIFLSKNPDFPNDDAAAGKLMDTVKQLNLPVTPENMELAHAYCLRKGDYKPLTAEQVAAIQAQSKGLPVGGPQRATPPPTLQPTGSPAPSGDLSDAEALNPNTPIEKVRAWAQQRR